MIQKNGNINQTIKKCSYVVSEQQYCGKPTKYKFVLDEEGNKVTDWDYLCPEHRAKEGGNYWSND